MSEIFLKIINMSISASYIVLAVLLLRLLLKKAPKWITVVLWGIVAIRLVCPFSIESVLSLIPSAETVSPDIMMDRTPEINTGIPIINQVINPVISGSFTPDPGTSANPLQLWIPTFAAIWILGMVALLIYTVISYARVRRKIGTAVLLRNNIYQSENVVSPFVLGIIKPKIYLPFNMTEKDMEHVVAHEMAHIRRKDHLWKPLGFILLTLHWFNPLMWLGYVLLCRDIELACDEKVIKELDHDARADYSQALLTCSVNRRVIAACPLAFGEVGVKDRVKSVLNYKKPAFWIIIAAVVACVAVAVCFLTNPINANYKGPLSCIRYDGEKDGLETITEIDFTEDAAKTIISILNESKWKDGVTNCGYDIEFTLKNAKVTYHSECGTLVDQKNGRFSELDTETRAKLNRMVGVTSNEQILSFVPPASDSDKLSYIYISAFGCDVKDATINFEKARFEDGKLIFDIHWTNEGSDNIDIGPDFEVYKYNGSTLEKLDHNGVWLYYREILPGKGMTVDGNYELEAERTSSYTISEHYDVLTPGKYRFEAHGAWVEFEVAIESNTLKRGSFDKNWIIGKTSVEIEQKYGVFDISMMPLGDGDVLYRNCGCGYMIKKGVQGILGTSADEFFMIYFDSDGIACEIKENVARPGG